MKSQHGFHTGDTLYEEKTIEGEEIAVALSISRTTPTQVETEDKRRWVYNGVHSNYSWQKKEEPKREWHEFRPYSGTNRYGTNLRSSTLARVLTPLQVKEEQNAREESKKSAEDTETRHQIDTMGLYAYLTKMFADRKRATWQRGEFRKTKRVLTDMELTSYYRFMESLAIAKHDKLLEVVDEFDSLSRRMTDKAKEYGRPTEAWPDTE